jgi:hypothetical protein
MEPRVKKGGVRPVVPMAEKRWARRGAHTPSPTFHRE